MNPASRTSGGDRSIIGARIAVESLDFSWYSRRTGARYVGSSGRTPMSCRAKVKRVLHLHPDRREPPRRQERPPARHRHAGPPRPSPGNRHPRLMQSAYPFSRAGHAYVKHHLKAGGPTALGNRHLHQEQEGVYRAVATTVLGGVMRPVTLVDWTDSGLEPEQLILKAAVPAKGRATSIYEERMRNHAEDLPVRPTCADALGDLPDPA